MKFIILLFVLTQTFCSTCQVSLSLIKNPIQKLDTECFIIQLSNESNTHISLAGQNYRLFYNSQNNMFNPSSLASFLPSSYLPFSIVENIYHADASSYGELPFDGDLGFLNLATDYQLNSNNAVDLGPKAKANIATICFNSLNSEKLEAVWAEDTKTSGYATAFNEIAQINDKGFLEKINILTYSVVNEEIMPDVFALGLSEKPLETKLGFSTSVSYNKVNTDNLIELNDIVFDKTKGNYILLCTKENINTISMYDLEDEFVYFKTKTDQVLGHYEYDLYQAKKFKNMLFNMGLNKVSLFIVNDGGDIEEIRSN